MPTSPTVSQTNASSSNSESAPHDLFALTDEQILEIEPEETATAGPSRPAAPVAPASLPAGSAPSAQESRGRLEPGAMQSTADSPSTASTEHGTRGTEHETEPPPWLAAQMKDPWSGEEARELWNGVVQARQEAAAYRAAIPTPEDARTLKELYPGGVNEARAAAGRARLLEEIDGAYFGAAGRSPQEVSASRANLAQHLLREDPAAFREMVFAGLRALEEAEKGSAGSASTSSLPRLAQVFAANRQGHQVVAGATLASPAANVGEASSGGASPAPTGTSGPPVANEASNAAATGHGTRDTEYGLHESPVPSHQPLSAYVAFEKAANEDLERSVGAAIERTLQQALPNLKESSGQGDAGARQSVPLRDRLGFAVRQDVEAALKGDRQLGEQIAQILSARRFDNGTRAQVVRLIDDRARQLVPAAAKRVINDWTHATLAAHRGNASRSDAASARKEVAAVLSAPSTLAQASAGRESPGPRADQSRHASTQATATPRSRGVDYRKLSDEQILDL